MEDQAQEQIVGSLLSRLVAEAAMDVELVFRNATGGRGRVVSSFRTFARDVASAGLDDVMFVVVATDANCKGYRSRRAEFDGINLPVPIVFAIPDPHVERWLLLDGSAFADVVGKGCQAPPLKCERHLFKQMLAQAVRSAGVEPIFGGLEYASEIVKAMDFDRAAGMDASLRRFLEDVRSALRRPDSD